jgi:hypothetical protein
MTNNTQPQDRQLCKCGKVGEISCPHDERCESPQPQLLDEVMKKISKDCETYVGSVFNWMNGDEAQWNYLRFHYKQIATEYATQLYACDKANSALEENNRFLATIKEELNEKLNKATRLLEKVVFPHEGGLLPDRLLYNEIKTFLDGK